jgi:PKD repeat protein/microcompartment protein CcmK/EutM
MKSFLLFFLSCFFVVLINVNTIYGQCNAGFTASSTSVCEGGNITFTIDNATALTTWYVDGLVQQPQVFQNTTITFNNSGVVKVKAVGNNNCADSVFITVHAPPTTNFTFNNNNQCAPMLTTFANTTTGGSSTYSFVWQDNNNQFSTQNNPQRTFSDISSSTVSHDIKLTIIDANGCTDNITKTVTVLGRPDVTLTDDDTGNEWRECGSATNVNLSVSNGSSTTNNSNYSIIWNGNAANYGSTTPPVNLSTTYNNLLGYDTITYIITNTNSCTNTENYFFFNGSNPSGGISSPGNTINFCAPLTVDFPVNNTVGNTPGTIYIFSFDDGSPNDTILHPVPSIYSHTFTESSCNNTTIFGSVNSFSIRMKAENPCYFSNSQVDPVIVSSLPAPDFTHPDNVCQNTPVTFNSISETAYIVSSGSCDSSIYKRWEIVPMTGVTINSSNLTGTSLQAIFGIEGTYTVSLIDSNSCGFNTVSYSICIVPVPIASYDIGNNTQNDTVGCLPNFIISNITNTSNTINSCFETYSWSINNLSSDCITSGANRWTFINGTTNTSENPDIQFNEPGQYELVLFIDNSCSINSSFSRTITVQEKPQVSISQLNTTCQFQDFFPNVIAFNNCYAPVTNWTWTATNGTIDFPNQEAPGAINFNTFGIKTITVSAQNICGTTIANSTLNINVAPPPPTLTGNTPCLGQDINITSSGGTQNTNYQWSFPDGGGLSLSNISRPNSTLNMGGDYLLTVTDPTTNCFDTVSVFVPVYPLPNITIAASNQNPCVNTPITLTASGATSYVWQWQGGNSSNNPLSINPTQDSTYAVIGTDDNNCISNANIFISTIPLPIVNAGANMIVCFQNPAIGVQLTGSPNGGIWSAIGNIGTNTISSSGLFTPNQVMSDIELVYTYTNSNTTCENSDIMEIDVILPDVADAGNNTDVCVGSSVITLSGNYNNTGTWRQSGSTTEITTFDPTTVGIYYFVYTIGIESCITHDTMKIMVNDLPNVIITASDLTPCATDDITLVASGALTYTWAFLNGNIPTDSLFVNPSQSTTYTVVGTNSNGCKTVDSITINPIDLPIVNAGNDTSACFQTPTISMQLTGTQDTGMPNDGTWSAVGDISPNTISTNGVFSPNGIASNIQLVYTYTDISTGCVSSDTLEIDVIAPTIAANVGNDTTFCAGDAAITFINIGNSTAGTWRSLPSNIIKTTFNPSMAGTYLFSFTLGAGSCETKDTLQITVNPLPNIFLDDDFPICRIDSLIDLSENPTNGIWSGTGIINTTTGEFNPSLVNANSTTLNYTYTDGNGCTNDDNITINVNDVTEAIAGSDTSFCNITTDIQLAGFSPTAAGGTWSGTEMQQDSQGIFNSNGVSDTYTAYYTFINNDGCKSVDSIEITVNNLIKPELQNDTAVCINTNNLTLSVTPAGGTWTMNNGTFNNLFTTDTSGIYEIIYEIGSGTTCESSDTLEIRVEDLPQITLANDSSVCADAGTIDLSETPNGGTWLGIGITNTSTGAFEVSNGTQTLTYTYIESQVFYGNTLECSNKDSVTITVNLLPIVTVPDTIVYCLVDYDITLPTGSPLGGTWVGTGITAPNQFNPTTAGGVGNYTATYTFIDGNTCESSDNMHIRVEASDSVSAGFNDTICITQTADTLKHFYPTIGGTWSGNGVASNGFFNPVQAGAGLHILTFTYGNGSCQVAKSKEILVVDTTVIDAGLDQTACLNEPAFLLTGFSPTGGIWTGINIDSIGIFTPTSEGSFLLKYTFAESVNGCISEDTKTITINALPIPEAQSDTTLCAVSTTINLPSGTANVNGTSIWTGSNAIISNTNLSVNPSIIGANDSAALYFTFTDIHTCSVMDSMELSVIAADSINPGINDTVCINAGSETLVGYPAGGIWSGNGIINDSIFNNINDNTPAAIYTLTYTFDNGNGGCEVTDTRIRTVRDLPTVNAGNDEIRCLNEPSFQLTGSPSTNGNGTWSGTDVDNNGLFTPTNIGTFTLTYTFIDFFGCENSDIKTITINPLPIPDAKLDTTLCAVSTTINLPSGTANVNGTSIWTGSNAIIPNTNLSVNPSFIGAGNSAALYFTFTDIHNCSVMDSMELSVIAADSINAGINDTVCINAGLETLVGYPAGGTWSGNGIINNSIFNNLNNQTPPNTYTLTYTFDNGNGGCEVTDTRERTIRALPVMTAALDTLVCIEAPAFSMFGFSPITDLLGIGIWSGNGITNENIGIFESDTAGIGEHILTYVYTDFVGCVDSNNRTINVVDLPIIDTLIGADTLCNQPFGVQYVGHQNSGNPNDGVWSGANMAQNGTFTPNGVGDFMVYYCYTDNNTCERCDSTIITVIPAEPIEAGVADTICIDEGIYLLTAEFPTGGFWSGSTAILNTIDGTFDPLIATSGWHTVTYTYGSGTCLVSDTTGVYVRDLAFVDAGAAENACETDADFTIFGFSPIGGTWSGTGITNNSGIFSPITVTPNTYPITYFYTDSITGCDTSRIKNVFVHPLSQPDFTFDTTLCINIPYTITDLSTNTTQWFWDFGDGTTYTTQNPTHTYSQTGNFIIKLTATSVHGCKDSTTLTVFVTEIPTASFTKDTTDGCTPLPVNFTNTSTGDLMEYSWNLGNNSPLILNLNPPTTIYEDGTQDTTYTITLTTSNLCGSADFVDSVLVYPKPQIIFAPDVNSGCTPLTVDLVNSTSGNPDNFYWNYGDGNLDTISNQNTHDHTFYTDTTPTVYTITLIAENECGLDTATTFVTVNPVTVESFFNTDTSIGCQPFTTNFTNYSTQGTTVIWNFGDGSSADTINSTSHTFTQVGTFKVVQYVTNGCGYDSTFTWITVLPSPVATFTNQNNICEDAALTFTNTTANTIGQAWNFGDGTTSTNSVATHIYTTAGTYQVTLTVFNNSSQCPGFKTKTITILPKPIAISTPSVTNGCEDLVVQFTDASIGNITGYSYNFGDNNSVVTASPTHTYLDSGVYIVNYFVVDANTCVSDIDSQNIVVYPVPTSDFTFAILDSCTIPTNVQFTNLSQGATGYEWTVDNSSNVLATNNPMVTYNSEGIYNIELKAISIHGCRDSSQQIFELFAPPVAVWNVDQPNYCQPSTVTFTNLSTGNGLSHFYNFDDSSGTNTPSPVHLYTDIGTYNPTYFVTDNNGCSSDTLTQTLYVRPVPTSDFAFAILDSCAIPAPVAFTNLSQGATNYEWRFGNGQITYNTNPTEIYNQEGNYTVELVAENIHGCRDSSQQIFELFAPPVAVWNVDQANSCLPSEVIFTNNSIGNGLNHFYNFGNGNTSTTPSPTHIFTAVGTYNSTYFVIDSNSCLSDTLDEIIEVYPVPTSDFTFKILDSCEIPTLVGFTNLSQGATNYEWRLDNGQILGNISPTTYYNQAGTYTVELVAKNSFSCRDSSQQTFEIFAPPTGFVSYEQLDTCEPSLVQFYPNASNATDYFWNFGNGQTSFIPEPIATYQTVGIYDVSLILGVNNICFDTLTYNDFIQVFPRPFANFVHLDTMTDGRFKGVIKFINTSIGANQYVWDFADNTTSNLENPTYAFRSNGLFDVQLIATNSYNCSDDTIISVRPDFFGTLEIPNIMAPGFGTGEDRFFIPKGIGLETYLVEVFDKQGTRIWYSDEIDTDGRPTGKWDGMFQGQELPQGAYVWKVKAQFINGSTVHRTGTVTIVR